MNMRHSMTTRTVLTCLRSVLVLLVFLATASLRADVTAPTAVQLEFFEKDVRPLLVKHCYECHSVNAKKIQAGLLLDSRAGLLKGGDSGAAITLGDVDGSLLIEAVRYESYEMPPKGKLSDSEITIFEKWIENGAPWPEEAAPTADVSRPEFDLKQRQSEHWVWQPIQVPPIPEVLDSAWPRDRLDNFILGQLEQAKLHPAPDADRSALLRRLYFDIIGFPPTPEQAAKFLNDTSPTATKDLVDELLDSPHFGERWGRHWLDLVRYAESRGHEFDNDTPNAYQYRDYIIRALNADVPYDQLVREHIAGDLLPEPRLNPEAGFNESILGTGFWFMGEWVHSPVDIRKDEADRFDNMIDVMSKTFLGVTVSCARCHDHKFDAISTADYYSLSGFLQSSDFREVRFESIEHNRGISQQLAALDDKYQKSVNELLKPLQLEEATLEPLSEEVAASVAVNYETLPNIEYIQDGYIFGDHARLARTPYLENSENPMLRFATESAAVSDSFWNGLESLSENVSQDRGELAKLPRSGRTLRTPTFELTSGNVACRVDGVGHIVACVDSHRLIAGPLHGETVVPVKGKKEWVQLNLSRYIGHRIHLEFTPALNEQLAVSLVTLGASGEVRQQLDQRAQIIAASVAEFEAKSKSAYEQELKNLAVEWAAERSELQAKVMTRSRLAMAMLDGTGEEDRILIRGNSSKPGDIEPRHFLTAVTGGEPMVIKSGSGRFDLAELMNDPQNPLTSRVIVNRIWHYLMGRGIVPTTDDFGVLGQRPTHPELLDHLAIQFLSDGRSIKQMIRTIVLSRTYQMSSLPDPLAVATDPNNLLWHHRPPKRLEGEAVRDALLLISGRLNPESFGEPVPIHLTPFMDGRGRPGKSGPLDGEGRRSIYTSVRRNFLSPFMLTFDTPTPFSTMGRRNVSNVPAQALILMNDPLVIDLANSWAMRAIAEHSSVESRINWMYQSAFARQPSAREAEITIGYLNAQAAERNVDQNDLKLWTDFAHVLINTKEFIFLR